MTKFDGKVLFLDRSDINTDEIIPAKYLTEISKAALKPYCLEDLKVPGFDPKKDIAGKTAIVTRANFGCGSSREHAPVITSYSIHYTKLYDDGGAGPRRARLRLRAKIQPADEDGDHDLGRQ